MRNEGRMDRRIGIAALALLAGLVTGCRPDGHDEHAGHADHGGDDEHDEHEDHAEHEDDLVELTATQAETAGIVVDEVSGGAIERTLAVPAVVAENLDSTTHVNPKAPGIVRTIHRNLGESVLAGDLLAVIDSVELGASVADLLRARALVSAAETTLERESTLFEQRLATEQEVLEGAIEVNRRIHAREQELREQAVSTIRPLLEAERALEVSLLERDRVLTELRAERDARLLALEVDLAERRIRARAAERTLEALGLDVAALSDPTAGTDLLAGRYEIRSPREGIVVGRHITAGEFVDSGTKLFTLEDLSRVWVVASVFEGDLLAVHTGQAARIRMDAFPDRIFEGQVTVVGYAVDRQSRSLPLRLELDNPVIEGWGEPFPLRPGMFGGVELVVEAYAAQVVIPERAVVHGDGGDQVFVALSEQVFEPRAVVLGAPSGERVEVLSGLSPGERIAVQGTFFLKSALRAGELGGGHSH